MPPIQNIEDAISELRRGGGTSLAVSRELPSTTGITQQKTDTGIARNIADECESLATAIQQTGTTLVIMATGISEETQALAELLRKHGAAMRARIEEFMTMSGRVRDKMRSVHGDMVGFSTAERSARQTGGTQGIDI
jgi:hypothetical protein